MDFTATSGEKRALIHGGGLASNVEECLKPHRSEGGLLITQLNLLNDLCVDKLLPG